MKHFQVNQLKHEMNVPVAIINKIYDNIIRQEQTEQEYDDTTTFDGEVTVNNPSYEEYVDKIQETFPLRIHLLQHYILFKDPAVRDALVNSTYCTDHIGITNEDALAMSKFGTGSGNYYTPLFQNTDIETFDELNLFTNIIELQRYEFRYCSKLKSINLSNIKSMGYQAFNGCTNLKIDLNLPNLTTLGGAAFYQSGITSVSNLGTVSVLQTAAGTGYSWGAFGGCTSLETVYLNNNIKEIQSNCFFDCTALRELNLPTSITKLGESVFQNCTALENTLMYLPNVTNIGLYNWSGTYIDILYLNSLVTTPNGYYSGDWYHNTTFGSNRADKSYKYIYLKDIESLGSASFTRVIINALIINNVTPPVMLTSMHGEWEQHTFDGIRNIYGIYVPDSAIETYKTNEQWSVYANIIKGISEFPKVATYEEFMQRKEQGDDITYLIEEYM